MLLASSRVEARDAAERPAVCRTAPTAENDAAANVTSAKGEKAPRSEASL